MKTCTKCGETKAIELFALTKKRVPGTWCKACKYAYVNQWKASKPDYMKDYLRRWRAENQTQEEFREYHRAWRRANPDKVAVLSKRARQKHHEDRKAWARNRRARIKEVGGSHTAADISKMLKGQKHRCWWCGKKTQKHHVDHRIPIALGGTNDPANLVLACLTCNVRKWKKMPAEFCGRLL